MIAWLGIAWAAPVQLDRVDLLSEAPGTWLPYEAPRLATAPGVAALRLAAQVSPVFSVDAVELSLSLSAQSLAVRTPLFRERVFADAAVVTRAFLPVGARVGLAWRPGPVRIGLSLVALSDATWVRTDWRAWTVMPALGLGVGRDLRTRAPWM